MLDFDHTFYFMFRFFLFLVTFSFLVQLNAQEQFGVRMDAYMGMQTAFLNPSHTANQPLKWNLNIAGAGLFIDNSYLFLSKTNVPNLLANADKVHLITEYKGNRPPDGDIVVDFFSNKRKSFATLQTKINGPAFTFHKGHHSGGIFYNAKFFSEAVRIPSELNYYELEKLPYKQVVSIRPVEARMMAWDEFGANYAYNWETNVGRAQLGINVKYLRGFEGMYAGSWSTINFARFPKDTVQFGTPDATLALTTGNLNNLKDGNYELQQ
jgi:hypothetical protein